MSVKSQSVYPRALALALLAAMGLSTGRPLRAAADDLIAAPSLPGYAFSEAETQMFYDLDAFRDMKELVKKATKSIRVDFYIFGGPDAKDVVDTLIVKKRQGLDVRVMLDKKLGSLPSNWKETKPILKQLRQGGVPVIFYSAQRFMPTHKARIIDHNKYIVIDQAEATVGSTNFCSLFEKYHDLLVHFKGPVAVELAQQFDFDWERAWSEHRGARPAITTNDPSPARGPETTEVPADHDHSMLRLLSTGLGRSNILESIIYSIDHAKKSIDVMVHEFDDPRIVKALVRARDRGVRVRVMMDPWSEIDKFLMGIKVPHSIPNVGTIQLLTAAGIQPRLYHTTPDKMTAHMKMVIIDDEVMHVGSANWTDGAWEHVAETNLEVHGGRAVREAVEKYESDYTHVSDDCPKPTKVQILLYKAYKKVLG